MARITSRAKARITIGLVNNMSDAALAATERQFTRLLAPALRDVEVHLSLFYLPEIARGDAARAQLQARYASIDALGDTPVDALVVTGCEPVCANLRDEPYWESLTRLIDWAKDNTVSTIWSCLAAHAAVLHLDGIERERLPRKLAGIYEFARMSDHRLLRGITGPLSVPHSRLNGLNADELVAHGYELLTHSDRAGVGAFLKKEGSLFVFLQGHPEYERDSLYREYRRDMNRYLTGKRPTCPALPEHYFDDETRVALSALAEEARLKRTSELAEHLPATVTLRSRAGGEAAAARFFVNWLGHVAETKARQPHPSREHASA
ncbi:MAG: homoserine O-succinyltransferase [Methylobacteriaceae bacterium]|nr:homoserine O-succinyltransferase [Methylobacteriaceae bacterium]